MLSYIMGINEKPWKREEPLEIFDLVIVSFVAAGMGLFTPRQDNQIGIPLTRAG